MPRLRQVTDAALLHAMAHPLRLRLLGTLRKEGPATASQLGRRLGESSASASYHLRELAKYGFIEQAPELDSGRMKHWRAVEEGMQWSTDTDDAGLVEASSVLGRVMVAEYARWLLRWFAETPEWDRPWRAAAEGRDEWFELTPEELRSLSDEVTAVLERYADRRTQRDGTERAIVLFHAFPERREAA
ncbi:MAG TPA: helix-turn-helix domain-containing protein [Thermoleophilaceae bacterium]